jgi:hypothetical protein
MRGRPIITAASVALSAVALSAVALSACAIADRATEPFMSLLTGEELADVAPRAPVIATDAEPAIPEKFATGYGEPLAVIRYNSAPDSYDQALGVAVSRTLAVRPGAAFDVVSVAPPAAPGVAAFDHSDQAVANAAAVMEGLMRHGVAPGNIDMSAVTDTAAPTPGEVHIYVR